MSEGGKLVSIETKNHTKDIFSNMLINQAKQMYITRQIVPDDMVPMIIKFIGRHYPVSYNQLDDVYEIDMNFGRAPDKMMNTIFGYDTNFFEQWVTECTLRLDRKIVYIYDGISFNNLDDVEYLYFPSFSGVDNNVNCEIVMTKQELFNYNTITGEVDYEGLAEAIKNN